jgi:hypothetical protein
MPANVRYNMPGPIDVPQDTNSGLDLLTTNRTLMAMPLKGAAAPRKPEDVPIDYLKSTESVMEWAGPQVKAKMKTGNPENPEVDETVHFRGGIEAFTPKAIKKNSPWLRRLQAEFQASEALVDRIDKNPQFRKALDNPDTREAIIAKFLDIIAELEASLGDTAEE